MILEPVPQLSENVVQDFTVQLLVRCAHIFNSPCPAPAGTPDFAHSVLIDGVKFGLFSLCGAAKVIDAGQTELHVILLILQDPKEHVGVGKHGVECGEEKAELEAHQQCHVSISAVYSILIKIIVVNN